MRRGLAVWAKYAVGVGAGILAVAASADAGSGAVAPRDVGLCEMMNAPTAFDLKTVRIEVRIERLGDGSLVLRDAACPNLTLRLGKSAPGANADALARLRQTVGALFALDGRSRHFAARATLTGVFDLQGAFPDPALLPLDAAGVQIVPTVFWTVS